MNYTDVRILIVEDVASTAGDIREALCQAGFDRQNIKEVNHLDIAKRLISRGVTDPSKTFHVITADLHMNGNLWAGTDLCEHIRLKCASTEIKPVVIVYSRYTAPDSIYHRTPGAKVELDQKLSHYENGKVIGFILDKADTHQGLVGCIKQVTPALLPITERLDVGERAVRYLHGRPATALWAGIASMVLGAIVTAVVCFLVTVANIDAYGIVRAVSVILIAVSYIAWALLFGASFLLLPKRPSDFLEHVLSSEAVRDSIEVGCARLRAGMNADLENEADEVMATYTGEFRGHFPYRLFSYLSHVLTAIILGAAFTYALVYTSILPDAEGELTHLSRGEPFLKHVYFSVVTFFTIGYGDVHPVSSLAQVGTIVQCLAILVAVIFGLSYLISFETGRMQNVRNAVLTYLRPSLRYRDHKKAVEPIRQCPLGPEAVDNYVI
jgi:hypothetical protein